MIMEVADTSFLEPFVGTHRVQRIPKRSSARHTSTATVAILDASAIEVDPLDESDLAERYTRGSGKGGQHRNKTDSCVVLTHVPTGIEARVDGRNQWQNRQEARRVLAKRVAAVEVEEALHIRNGERNGQIDSERSAKSFTHNTQRDEVVDHSTGRSWRLRDFAKGKF
jgi:peptide chain release factor 1